MSSCNTAPASSVFVIEKIASRAGLSFAAARTGSKPGNGDASIGTAIIHCKFTVTENLGLHSTLSEELYVLNVIVFCLLSLEMEL